MHLLKIIVGEMIVLVASVLVFRSLWTLLAQYLGNSNLIPWLIVGIVLTIVGLLFLNHEIKCELDKNKKVSTIQTQNAIY